MLPRHTFVAVTVNSSVKPNAACMWVLCANAMSFAGLLCCVSCFATSLQSTRDDCLQVAAFSLALPRHQYLQSETIANASRRLFVILAPLRVSFIKSISLTPSIRDVQSRSRFDSGEPCATNGLCVHALRCDAAGSPCPAFRASWEYGRASTLDVKRWFPFVDQ